MRIISMRECLIIMMLATCASGCWNSIRHNEALAKKRALDFAEITFVKQDFDRGYAQLSRGAKSHVSIGQFKQAMARWHPDGYPSTLAVTGYKPVWSQDVAYVFIGGEASEKKFQYIITLEGTADSDYKVSVVIRTS